MERLPDFPYFRESNAHMPLCDRLLTDRRGEALFRLLPVHARIHVDAGERGSALSELFHFDDGQRVRRLELTVRPSAGLAGKVSARREPAAGYAVVAVDRQQRDTGFVFRTETDAEGRYALEGLPPGAYLVLALAPSFPDDGPTSFASADLPHVVLVDLTAGETREVDLEGPPRPGVIAGVVERDGVPVAGVLAGASEAHDPFSPFPPMHGAPGTTTDDRGEFALSLAPGRWSLWVWSMEPNGRPGERIGGGLVDVEAGRGTRVSISVGEEHGQD